MAKKKVIREYNGDEEEEMEDGEEGTEMRNMATRSSGHKDDEEVTSLFLEIISFSFLLEFAFPLRESRWSLRVKRKYISMMMKMKVIMLSIFKSS